MSQLWKDKFSSAWYNEHNSVRTNERDPRKIDKTMVFRCYHMIKTQKEQGFELYTSDMTKKWLCPSRIQFERELYDNINSRLKTTPMNFFSSWIFLHRKMKPLQVAEKESNHQLPISLQKNAPIKRSISWMTFNGNYSLKLANLHYFSIDMAYKQRFWL